MNTDASPDSLGSVVEQAAANLSSGADSGRSAGPDVGRTAGPPADKPAAVQPPAYEPPGWTKRWKEPSRKALEALYTREDVRPHWEAIQSEFDETYKAYGQQGQEYGEFRKRVEPVWNILSRYEPQYRLQGMTLEQGVGQLVQAAEYLASNPDEALPWLAQTYAPKDAAAVIRALGQAWGVDLGQVTQDQHYVDPYVAQQLQQAQQLAWQANHKLQTMEQQNTERLRYQIVDQIAAFESATDANGNPLYPHFREVFDLMPRAIQMGLAQDLASAYQFAVRNHPEISKRIEQEQAEAAKRKALEEAAARSKQAEEAKAASRNIGAKGRPVKDGRKKSLSLSDAISMAAEGRA